VHPQARAGDAWLQRGDPVPQLAVMADEQDRRGRGPELVLEPALGWYVEVVVRPLLDGVSLRVGEGAKVALIGPSGTGKTSGS